MTQPFKIRFLGTGTSTGVPQLDCHCPVCTSADAHDKRLRTSALLTIGNKNILIDCGPDFRMQMLEAGAPHIDAVLLTHSHYDHVGGLDELRSYTSHYDLPIYCRADVKSDIMARLPYCFREHLYPGVAKLNLQVVEEYVPFQAAGLNIMPFQVFHYKLPILGFRIGDFAYVTDAKTFPAASVDALQSVRFFVVNALRIEEHFSHMSLAEALDVVSAVSPEKTFLIHMNHGIGFHKDIHTLVPPNVHFAYDGLEVEDVINC